MNILTAHEFHAQGTTPGNALAIATVYARAKDYDTAAKLRSIAHEVAKVSGVPFAARPNKRNAGNDNRRNDNSRRPHNVGHKTRRVS